MPRKLRVEFLTEEAFRREYLDNISRGGTFIPSRKTFERHELVDVEFVLPPAGESVELRGQVVHCVSPELAKTGASPGVAVEFSLASEELRGRLASLAPADARSHDEQEFGAGRRAAPRSRVRGGAQIGVDGRWMDGRLRNISSSGILIGLTEEPLAIGTDIVVGLIHPTCQDELELRGVVRRHLDSAGESLLGIEFRLPETTRSQFEGFLARLRTSEHNRHLGGINGPIADLGVEGLVRMFGGSAPQGVLTLHRGDEEGVISIDHGVLRARFGRLAGREALAALLAWRDGRFEFDAQMEELAASEEVPLAELPSAPELSPGAAPNPSPVGQWELGGDGAVEDEFEGLELDFGAEVDPLHDPADLSVSRLRVDLGPISDDATLSLASEPGGERPEDLSKTERALLDLASAGVTVGKAVEIIPDPTSDIYAALTGLIEMGFVVAGKPS